MIQRQPSNWSCLSTSFAIVLGVDVELVHKMVGHDGSEVVHPDLEEPLRRRAFHIQEMVDVCERGGYAVVQYDAIPIAHTQGREFELYPKSENERRFLRVLNKYTGVLTGRNPSGRPHAVAWNGFCVVDPALGAETSIERYAIDAFYALVSARHLRSY